MIFQIPEEFGDYFGLRKWLERWATLRTVNNVVSHLIFLEIIQSSCVQINYSVCMDQPMKIVQFENRFMRRCSGITKVELEGLHNGEEMAFAINFMGGMKIEELFLPEIRNLEFFNQTAQ